MSYDDAIIKDSSGDLYGRADYMKWCSTFTFYALIFSLKLITVVPGLEKHV